MKFLFFSLFCAVLPAGAAQLKDVKSVYLYPMSGGFDQLLASRLTAKHIFVVVSDPKLADGVFTDQLGAKFEYRVNHIAPPAPGTPVTPEPLASSFARGRGTLFLVDPKSKQVLWSAYDPPKNGSPRELDRVAKKVVVHLTQNLKPEPAKQQ